MIRCNFLDLDKCTYTSMYLPQIPHRGDKIKFNDNVFFVHEITYYTHNGHFNGIEIGIRDAQNTLRQSILNQSI